MMLTYCRQCIYAKACASEVCHVTVVPCYSYHAGRVFTGTTDLTRCDVQATPSPYSYLNFFLLKCVQLLLGLSERQIAPTDSVTQAMFTQTLRMCEKNPASSFIHSFQWDHCVGHCGLQQKHMFCKKKKRVFIFKRCINFSQFSSLHCYGFW